MSSCESKNPPAAGPCAVADVARPANLRPPAGLEAFPVTEERPGTVVSPRMRKGSLEADAQLHGPIGRRSVTLDGVTVTEVTFEPGARWSLHLAAKAGTKTCNAPHVALVLSGSLRVRMNDGSEEEFREGDVMLLPPGHDAWTIGAAPCVFVDFSHGYSRYGVPESGEHLG